MTHTSFMCRKCGTPAPGSGSDSALVCPQCGTSLDPDATLEIDPDATRAIEMPSGSAGSSGWSKASTRDAGLRPGMLQPGSVLADRYEILQLLGEGGMGAVYKARDREVERLVALKVIRPELAGQASILQRFKQELLLARKITHRNIIRIFDLGLADGLRFITMEFVEGQDLASLLEQKKFSPPEAVAMIQQICAALEAAHAEGVIHRDLKPQNIVVEPNGRVCVMDFGLAKSLETTGMTQAGAVLGTPAYMSPEQALGETADARSDLFALGIIFYQALTGAVPYKADTAMATMLLRTQGLPQAPISLDSQIPAALNSIVMKLLAVKREERYQSATESLKDLRAWQGVSLDRGVTSAHPTPAQTIRSTTRADVKSASTALHTVVTPRIKMMADSGARKWIAVSLVAVVLLAGGVFGAYWYFNRPTGPIPPMTVIIADFNNHTGDAVFSGTLESTLKLALEGASFISAYDRTKMRDLGLPAVSALDASKAQEIAASQGLNVVVSGSLDHGASGYQLSVRAVQAVTGKVLTDTEATAADKDQVLMGVIKLGTALRKALGDSTSDSAQRLSMETLTAASLEAVHEYSAGLDMLSAGKFVEAQKHLQQAIDRDPNFGMAYTILASAARNQGRFQDAEQHIKQALTHIDRMTERERFRTRAYQYLLAGDHQKCVEEYGTLLEKYPSDTGAYTNIAVCLVHLHNGPRSLELAQRAAAILPKRAIYHSNLAMNLAYTGDFAASAKEAAAALKLGYANGNLVLAFASLGQDEAADAADAYHNLEKSNPSDAQTGLADLAEYEGRYSEAVAILEKGAAQDLAGRKPDSDAAATKYWMLAHVQVLRGQTGPAVAAANRALEFNQVLQTRFFAGQVFAAAGETAKARELALGLGRELQTEPQVYGKLLEGEIALNGGDAQQATTLFSSANNMLDTWIGRFDLGRAYLDQGKFTEADSEFDLCVKRRGEALTLFLDLPTYGYFPPVYYFQGRAREGMKTVAFSESYKKYLTIRGKKGSEDPLVPEIRKRAGL
jgi:tetratricopeptide (TPR) repeat protein/predicted Ser/Thr protein kinase